MLLVEVFEKKGRYLHTKLWESDKLAACLSSLVDPVDGLLSGELKVEPARLGVDRSSLVLADSCNHVD